MFQWYQAAGICYAYLSDVESCEDPTKEQSSFARSRWFTRGWTLQELLAPGELVFLGSDWAEIGTKRSLCATVSSVTCISQKALEECCWSEYSVAQKMSWAAGRKTTRLEDEAYCLMGLFDVNMPLLYGEGRKAFLRLQQEILRQFDDASIFAWSYPVKMHSYTRISGLFAHSPEYFKDASKIELLGPEHGMEAESPFQVVNRHIRLRQRMVHQVEAIRLERLPGTPLLYNVIEIKRGIETSEDNLSVSERTSPTDQKPEAAVNTKASWQADLSHFRDDGRPVPPPIITIETEDTPADPSLDNPGRLDENPSKIAENRRLGDDLGLMQGGASEDAPPTPSLGSEGLVALEKQWYNYIYEPAIIVQLRCHIGHHRLGIILSKSFISKDGSILWRLHNPSIVAMPPGPETSLPSLTTVYANLVTKITDTPFVGADPSLWSEIRIGSLSAAGYDVHQDCGPGWEFDRPRSVLIRRESPNADGSNLTKCVLFALFYRTSDEETASPARAFFLSLAESKPNSEETGNLDFVVGVIMSAPLRTSAFKASDYELYSFDLGKERWVEVPLGNGQALVLKYREGTGIRFVNVATKTLSQDKAAGPVPHDITHTLWLRSKIFPMLKSLK
ncbi:uncharacterized protein K444DRAFT_577101 [Hyaloscypha bicolor E]|uniref:DUF8212 domain-containing protein n=1 Tax=Hyaloscypha bicolor E TaxID=1095630 RepID=A0A2J6SGJ9_9HELO|nr:uncharacterized protein K444DRAFT_577101 [Hyaloscypha bicolor E]PMD49874.1 hypothetical protein K444DRAFT_577101 [Hyaloscypha bicolor E]